MFLRSVKTGETDVIVHVVLRNVSGQPQSLLTAADVRAWAIREGDPTPLVMTTAIQTYAGAGSIGSHDDYFFGPVDVTNMPGVYELHLPDSLWLAGSKHVRILMSPDPVGFVSEDFTILIDPPAELNAVSEDGETAVKAILNAADVLGLIKGAGFNTLLHSLVALRNKYNTDLSPLVVTASGTSDVEFINRVIRLIRKDTDEPSINAKYSGADLLTLVEQGFQVALADLNALTDNPMKVRLSMTVGPDTTEYLLPPSVEQIIRIARIDPESGRPQEIWTPRPEASWYGAGVLLEGRVLRLDPSITRGSDDIELEIKYIPNGDVRLHYGFLEDLTATTCVLDRVPSFGKLDTRENAYVGTVLRILSTDDEDTNYVQERTITAYDRTTREATLTPALDPLPRVGLNGNTVGSGNLPLNPPDQQGYVTLPNSFSAADDTYNGMTIRLVSGQLGAVTRTITDYIGASRRAYCGAMWGEGVLDGPKMSGATFEIVDTDNPAHEILYEIVPVYGRLIETQVALSVAERLVAAAGNPKKYQLLQAQHAKIKRANQMQLSKMENIEGDHFDVRTVHGWR